MEPLHKAGYYLNSHFFYPSFAEIEKKETFIQSVVECMHKFYGDNDDIFGRIRLQLHDYQHRKGSLGAQLPSSKRKGQIVIPIHTKKRNRLSPKKLHDLVFVKFNAKLQHKHSDKDRESLLSYYDEERVTDWVIPPS